MMRIAINQYGHRCENNTAHALHGVAVELVVEDGEGHLYAISRANEYASQVAFCPVCGHPAPTPPQASDEAPQDDT